MCPTVLFPIFLGVCWVIFAHYKHMPTTMDPSIRPRVAEGQKLDRRKAVPVVPLGEKAFSNLTELRRLLTAWSLTISMVT